MPLSYKELTQPDVEPVSVLQAKKHLRVDFSDDDDLIGIYVSAARSYCEKLMQRAIYPRTVLLSLDYFPWPGWGSTTGSTAHDYFLHWYYRGLTIRLPLPGTVSVESVTYLAPDGTPQNIDPSKYTVDLISEPARISPAPGFTWPYQQNYIPGQVKVNFTAGSYDVPGPEANNPCPSAIVAAILLMVGHLYEHRESVSELSLKEIPLGVSYLLAPYAFDTIEV